ncbi:unnamed protein product [Boreogadus saida]
MNRDMEEKGILLRELSCRAAAELPAPDLPGLAAVQLPEYTRRSSRKASVAVQLPEYTAGAAGLPLKPRRQSGGGSSAAVPQLSSGSRSLSPPCLLLRNSAKAPAAIRSFRCLHGGRSASGTFHSSQPSVVKSEESRPAAVVIHSPSAVVMLMFIVVSGDGVAMEVVPLPGGWVVLAREVLW